MQTMVYSDREVFEAIRTYPSVPIPQDMLEACKKDPLKSTQIAAKQGTRWLEAEPYIIDSVVKSCTSRSSDDWALARNVTLYCCNAVLGRWRELEDAVLEAAPSGLNMKLIVDYCNLVLKNRWAKIESYIKTPSGLHTYAREVLKERWPEKEVEILKDKNEAFSYCTNIIGERWKELEQLITNHPDSSWKQSKIISYCEFFGRWPEAEEFITSPNYIFQYATRVIRGRWKEKESQLAKDACHSFSYAQQVINGAFPEAEKSIIDSPWYFDYFTFATKSSRDLAFQLSSRFPKEMTIGEVLELISDGRNADFEKKLLRSTHNQGKAVWYAVNVLKSRWPEMEERIKRSAKWAVVYARDIIGGRWEDAEKAVSKSSKYLSQYGVEVVKGKLPVSLHNKMIAFAMTNPRDKNVKGYFEMLGDSP